ncbi:MAG TPA: TonB-dependent receptor [Bryobacteraceae bacterium]|nr:TonB-dependent receptor [Bryobacteraceae bacterium]
MKTFALRCATAAIALSLASIAFGQITASVGGTVSDPSGALVPKVNVSARNINTGIVSNTVTNETGAYQFPSLQPGSYTISATAAGFQTATYNDVQLGQNQQVRLNFSMQLATGAQSVEVEVQADTAIATTSSSVGGVIAEKDVLSQPLASRNVLDLVALTPGVISVPGVFVGSTLNFAGVQQNQVNTTRDGLITNDGRYANGAYSGIFTSPDMVEEVRVSTNQIDPSLGRGAAQVQMRTRSGSNEFHGAAFWTNNNSVFNAATYFQNLQHQPVDYANRNQFGGRVGGPIKKNKAFFFVLTDDQRYMTKVNDVATVLTAPARQGIFRYLTAGSPGGAARTNGNAFSSTPSVDLNGNILTSAGGQPLYLNSVNLLAAGGPNFSSIDPLWFGPQYTNKYMPLPNNYTVGDGLNTAGFQWQQPENGVDGSTGQSPSTNRNNITLRFDYQINAAQSVNFVMSKERDWGVNTQTGIPDYPAGYFGDVRRTPSFYSAAWTWTIRPTLLNEFRFGHKVDTWQGTSAMDLGCCWNGAAENSGLAATAQAARASYPQLNGSFLYTAPGSLGAIGGSLGLYAGMNVASPRQTISPFWQFGDSLSWIHGSHSLQFGFEIDRTSSQSANSGGTQTTRPTVNLGIPAGGVAPPITTATFPGIGALNLTTAQNLLANLAGEVANVQEQYWVNSPTATNWNSYLNDFLFYRTNHQNAWSGYVKDTWKVNPNLTVNAGLRYDFFGAPYQDQGLAGRPLGGQAGLFGISGTSFAAMWNPYANGGALTTAQFVGPNSPNPGLGVYNNYWKALGPSIGVAYQLPWFKRATVIRAGYGINYIGNVDFLTVNTGIGNFPGQTLNTQFNPSTFVNLSSLLSSGNVPVPTGTTQPFTPVPLTGPTSRTATIYGYADNLRTPYIQSYNFSIQRELTSTLTVDFNFIGNKGSELYTNQQLNETNIFENGILNAFNTTRAGGNAPLFDTLLNGITIPGVGTVNGTSLTGSQALRQYSVTNTMIANGSVGALANFFNTTSTGTGANGGLLSHAGLPQNFIVVNPQFAQVFMIDNNGNSTYNAFQAHIMKRLTHGVTGQFSYTFSKTLGDTPAGGGTSGGIRDWRNMSLSKSLLPIDRPQLFQWNITWDLPIGSKRALLGNAPKWMNTVVGGWQVASAFQWQSGVPLTFFPGSGTSLNNVDTIGYFASNTADLVGQLPSNLSTVVKGNGFVQYFPGLSAVNAPAPNFGGDPNLPGRFTNLQVVNASGQPVLANPNPGTTGNTPYYMPGVRSPGLMGFNASASKLFRLTESKTITLRADAINILNTPQFGYYLSAPPIGQPPLVAIQTNIDSPSFGRITSATGNRMITFYARFDF